MTRTEVAKALGFAMGGVAAAAMGEYTTAAKAFVLAAQCFVEPEELRPFLSPSDAQRAQMIADVDEVIKFGRLS